MIKLHVPLPPSLNSLYPGTVRRHKSKKYVEWIKLANMMLDKQHTAVTFVAPVQVTYRLGKPDKRNRDLANLEKAPSDLLVARGILADDSLIHRLVMEWADIEGCDIEIILLKTV